MYDTFGKENDMKFTSLDDIVNEFDFDQILYAFLTKTTINMTTNS